MAISKLPDLSPRQALLDRIRGRLSAPPSDLDRVVQRVLAALGSRLPLADARAVAHRLPHPFGAEVVGAREEMLLPTCAAFEERLRQREITPAVARAVILEVAATLGEQGRAHLRLQPLRPILDH